MNLIASPLLPTLDQALQTYRAHGGYKALEVARSDLAGVQAILMQTSLTGLGGARFPFSKKLQLALQSAAPRVVVCNAAEDEPGSRKDRTLLERNPHLVLEGALLAATAIGANLVFFYVSETLTEALESIERALVELFREDSLLDDLELRVCKAPTAYVAGEASAAIQAIEGREAKPVLQPPYPTESGVGGRPTLVSNCETLANLPRIVTLGMQGANEGSAFSRLTTVSGDVALPGVYEILADETTFADLIELAGGIAGPSTRLKAIQPGGPSSAYLPASAINVLLTDSAIRAAGSQPGCLAVRVLSEARCLVEEVADLTAFFAREQCGQCPGCRMKTQAYSKSIQQIQGGNGKWSMLDQLSLVDEFVADMPSLCALISMPTQPVMSAVALFRHDFEDHIERSACGVSQV